MPRHGTFISIADDQGGTNTRIVTNVDPLYKTPVYSKQPALLKESTARLGL